MIKGCFIHLNCLLLLTEHLYVFEKNEKILKYKGVTSGTSAKIMILHQARVNGRKIC